MSIRTLIIALALVAGAAGTATAKDRVQPQTPTGFMAEVESGRSYGAGPHCVWHNPARPSTDAAKDAARC